MAVIEHPRASAATGLFGGWFNRSIFGAIGAAKTWNDARVTRKALMKLSSKELDDIGLTLGDVDRMTGVR